jgi:hypothetical protein
MNSRKRKGVQEFKELQEFRRGTPFWALSVALRPPVTPELLSFLP